MRTKHSMLAPAPRIEPLRRPNGSRPGSGLGTRLGLATVVAAVVLLCTVRADTAEDQRPTDSGGYVLVTDLDEVAPSDTVREAPRRSRRTPDLELRYPLPPAPKLQCDPSGVPYRPDCIRRVPEKTPSEPLRVNVHPKAGRVDFVAYREPLPDRSRGGSTEMPRIAVGDASVAALASRGANQPAPPPPPPPPAPTSSSQNIPAVRFAPQSAAADTSIPPVETVRIPLAGTLPPGAVKVDRASGLVTAVVRDVPLGDVLSALAVQQGLNLITSDNITAKVSVTLRQVPFEESLTQILGVVGYTWVRQGNILIVTDLASSTNLAPHLQGRQVRVFRLDYIAAADADLVIQGLLSSVGQSFLSESMETDNRRTQELVIVEDLPDYLARIEDYIRQVDVPPRQVLIEVHILSVELTDDLKYGLNLEYLDKITPSLTLRTQGFADAAKFAAGTSPAFFFNLAGGDLNTLLEALETTTDAKTLATPKVLALNGQEARIQVGGRLGYRVTTTTQTSTMENVEFLDVGVVLTVTPRIAADGSVLMFVTPEVSTGEINPITQLPEEETTEVSTSLMLPNGHGMLIGGLIQESDSDAQAKIPILGDLWLIGRLFQKDEKKRKRTEIVIALIPHVVPYGPQRLNQECEQFQRATTPLTYGPLLQMPRYNEPRFPDAGQRLPLRYKTEHLHTLPDHGAWGPNQGPERCATGYMPTFSPDSMPGYMPSHSPEGVPYEYTLPGEIHGEIHPQAAPIPENTQVIPTPQPVN